jgi:hypothetical protein
MNKMLHMIGITALFLVGSVFAQIPATNGKVLVKEGTEVRLKFSEPISSKTASIDDRVNLELADDLKVGSVVVAKAGAKGIGSITNAKKAGMLGKAGELNMRLEYVKVGDTRLRLRASKVKEGEGKEGTAIALSVLFGPIGLIKHGKEVEIKAGTPITAFVDEDTWLDVASTDISNVAPATEQVAQNSSAPQAPAASVSPTAHKSMTATVLLGLLIPGGGNSYTGQKAKGALILATAFAGVALAYPATGKRSCSLSGGNGAGITITCYTPSSSRRVLGGLAAGGASIYGLVSAVQRASAINNGNVTSTFERLRFSLPMNKQARFKVAYNFNF